MRRLLIALTVGTAYFFTMQAVWIGCRFIEYQNADGAVEGAGLFSFSYRNEECINYRDIIEEWRGWIKFDPVTKTAQAMGVLASIYGGVAVVLTLFGSCFMSFFALKKQTWRRMLTGSLLLAAVCQSLTFLMFVQLHKHIDCDSEDIYCGFGWAGLCSIIASVLYLVAGLVVLVIALQPPKDNPGTTYLARLGNNLMAKMGITWKDDVLGTMRLPLDLLFLFYSLTLFLCSLTVILDCHFFTVYFNNNTREYSEGLMFYHYYPDNTCRRFERGDIKSFKSVTRAAASLGICATILGGFLMLFLWSSILLVNYPPTFYQKILPLLCFLAGICQSLVFLSNQERNDILCAEDLIDQSCEMGPNGYLAAFTVGLYMMFIPLLLWFGKNPNISLLQQEQLELEKQMDFDTDAMMMDHDKEEMAPPTTSTNPPVVSPEGPANQSSNE